MSTDTQTLRERFEKRYRIPENIYYSRDRNCYLFKNNHIAETYLQDEWKAYQSGAEDNQAEIDKYKAYHDAVLDHCVINHLPEKETPYQTIGNLCDFASEIALDPQVSPKAESLYQEIENMKRKLEDNQCVVELPKEPAGKWGDRKYSVEQVIAVIKASGARIK